LVGEKEEPEKIVRRGEERSTSVFLHQQKPVSYVKVQYFSRRIGILIFPFF
jgi:hypothetical protein